MSSPQGNEESARARLWPRCGGLGFGEEAGEMGAGRDGRGKRVAETAGERKVANVAAALRDRGSRVCCASPRLPRGTSPEPRHKHKIERRKTMKVLKNMTMGVLVLATASCASSAPPLQRPTVNVTGDWVGTWTCDFMREGSGVVVLSLTQ